MDVYQSKKNNLFEELREAVEKNNVNDYRNSLLYRLSDIAELRLVLLFDKDTIDLCIEICNDDSDIKILRKQKKDIEKRISVCEMVDRIIQEKIIYINERFV